MQGDQMAPTLTRSIPSSNAVRNKMVVRSAYDRICRNDFSGLRSILHKNFVYTSPKYLPWGGAKISIDSYLDRVIPQLSELIDFRRFTHLDITAEGDCVVSVFSVGIAESASTVTFCEHWFLEDEVIRSLWSLLFEPIQLLVAIEEKKRPTPRQISTWSTY
jgi:ketosteroid isomerase-like protein